MMRTVRLMLAPILAVLAATSALAQSSDTPTTTQSAPPAAAGPATPTPLSPAPLSRDATLKRGRQLVTWFYAQNLDPVWAAFLPSARTAFGDDLKMFQAYRAGGVSTYGKETKVISEDVQEQEGVMYYLRNATFERGPKVVWTVAFGLDAAGRVVSFGILGGTEAAPGQQAGVSAHRS